MSSLFLAADKQCVHQLASDGTKEVAALREAGPAWYPTLLPI